MLINLNVKVKAGSRTSPEAEVYSTSVNEKVLKFSNGLQLAESAIVDWIEEELTAALLRFEKLEPATDQAGTR